ncbi:hypothetical protein AGMMS50267_03730 [Spirochaetia bacterium]|nr:hypothetical protein AGMMS50267_03730 [Spirochaetia bacterium]
MKNGLFVTILFVALFSNTVFAQENTPEDDGRFRLSMGLGFHWYSNYHANKSVLGGKYVYTDTGGATSYTTINDQSFFGGYLFFDATYVEASIGLSSSKSGGSQTDMQFSLLGKYPFSVGSVVFFPMLGVEYNMILAKENGYGDKFGTQYYSWYFYDDGTETSEKVDISDLNTFWFKLGVGSDIPLSNKIYLRGEYLFGLAILSRVDENDYKEYYASSDPESYDYYINYSQTVKFSLGFKF